MDDIKLNEVETALWNEAGERGDQFRRAIRDRASEEMRVREHMIEVVDSAGSMVSSVAPSDPDPETPVQPAQVPNR
jgi:hypothetical protein